MERLHHSFVQACIFNEAKKGYYESGDSYHTVLTDDYFILLSSRWPWKWTDSTRILAGYSTDFKAAPS